MNKNLTIDGPEELLRNIPILLGYNPINKLVAVGLSQNTNKVEITVALDIVDFLKTPNSYYLELRSLIGNLAKDGLVLTIFCTNDRNNYFDLYKALFAEFENDFYIRDFLWVQDNRWASFMCTDEKCCPKEGKIIEPESSQQFDEEFEFLPDSSGEESVIEKISRLSRARSKAEAKNELANWQKLQFKHLSARNAFTKQISQNEARLLFGLTDIPIRDALLCHHIGVSQIRKNPSEYLKEIARIWINVASKSPQANKVSITSCIAALLWQAGDNKNANNALHLALKIDPTFRLANLLNSSIRSGLPASQFKDAFTKITNPWT